MAYTAFQLRSQVCAFILNFTLYILSPKTNIEKLSSLSFISEKLSSLILVSLGSKGKGFGFEKGKHFWAEGKKVCSYAHDFSQTGNLSFFLFFQFYDFIVESLTLKRSLKCNCCLVCHSFCEIKIIPYSSSVSDVFNQMSYLSQYYTMPAQLKHDKTGLHPHASTYRRSVKGSAYLRITFIGGVVD